MHKVSVIIPNYNHENFLQQRIDSILLQTYQNFELIILDDCSTDNSKSIIEQYRDHPKVSNIVYNTTNSGNTFKQWKLGLKLAKGSYIWFAESDDYADHSFLEKMVPELEKNPQVDLVFCNSYIIDATGSIKSNTNNWASAYEATQGPDKTTIFNGLEFCLKHMFYLCRIPNASAVLFRKEPVTNNPDWIDVSLRNAGDWKLWLNIALTSDILWLNQDLNYFRIHGANVTSSLTLLNKEAHIILKELIQKNNTYYRIYESLAAWSFKQASWTKGYSINITTIKRYFENNLSLKSGVYLLVYLNKQLLIAMKKKCRASNSTT